MDELKERLQRIKEFVKMELEEFENSPGFAVRIDGIQEENKEIREQEKQWLNVHFLELFHDIFPIVEYDQEAVFKFSFGYFCNTYYKQGKKVPITHKEFSVLFQTFLENAIELEGMLDHQSIQSMQILSQGFQLARLFEDAYIEKEIPVTQQSYECVVGEEFENNKKEKQILQAFLNQYEPVFMGSDNRISIFVHQDGKFHMHFGEALYKLYGDVQKGVVTFYSDKTKQLKINIQSWIQKMMKEYKEASVFAAGLRRDIERFFDDSSKKPVVSIRNDGEHYTIGLRKKGINMDFVVKEGSLYRNSGECVEYLRAIVSEFIERSRKYQEEQKIILERAQNLFRQLLSKNEKTLFDKEGVVWVEGEDYDYLIDTKFHHNNTVRFPKGIKDITKAETFCIVAKEVHVPKFDVLSSILLMIKSKKEQLIHEIGHVSPAGKSHIERWNELQIL